MRGRRVEQREKGIVQGMIMMMNGRVIANDYERSHNSYECAQTFTIKA